MKSWKKKLVDEFDACVPPLSEEVKSAPIAARSDKNVEDIENISRKSARRRLKPWLYSACAVAAAVVVLIIALYSPAIVPPTPTPTPTPTPEKGGGVYSLEINPSCAFITDEDGKVTAVRALNSDADVVLSNGRSSEFVGNSLTDAVKKYTDYAARLGYLNFESKGAVRLCGSGDQAALDSAASALTEYFMNKGAFVAVLKENKTAEELGEALGIEQAETLEGLADKITALSALYGERECANEELDRLQEVYSSAVLCGNLFELVQGELLENVEKIAKNASDLLKLVNCNFEIMMHDDNPAKDYLGGFLSDYWTIKSYNVGGYTEEFGALMTEMEGLLADYKEEYGKSFTSFSELKDAAAVYEPYLSGNFTTLFEQMNAADFLQNGEDLIKMLELIGEDVSIANDLLNMPKTVEEYVAKLASVLNEKFDFRLREYLSVYEKERETIAEADYRAFIDGIIGEYGSLEKFWNNK